MCHSSVIIRKHIDLTITLEQHSPAPQTGYLSPGGAGSDEAGSELILGLCCFTPPAALLLSSSPPLLCSPFSSCSTFCSYSALRPLPFCHLHSEVATSPVSCPSLVLCRCSSISEQPAAYQRATHDEQCPVVPPLGWASPRPPPKLCEQPNLDLLHWLRREQSLLGIS